MIVSRIYGGLAGQMLQYSLGRSLSLKNNTELFLETSWYKKRKSSNFIREFGLHHFNTKFKEINTGSIFWWKVMLANKFNNFNLSSLKSIKEVDFSRFDPTVLNVGNNIVLDGYWNSYKYFEKIREQLIEEFCPIEVPNEQNKSCLEKIKSVNSISVHFRRGDYSLTSFHGILSKEYYTKAINHISGSVSDPYLFIFSDEPEWVLSNMKFEHPYQIIDFNKDERNYWDIELMKNCKHNIIANSGFSWWAAWLNNNRGKIVVAPEKWINTEKSKIENIPQGWLLM